MEQFIRNCHAYKRVDAPRDQTPRWLQPLPVLERLWQHIIIDFKLFLKDAYSYNTAFIVIDWLYKQSISLPYFKTITTKDIARLYINNIY